MRTYRESWTPLFTGSLFVVIPILCFTGPALYHLFAAEPFLIRNRSDIAPHFASTFELGAMISMPLVVSALGLMLIIQWWKTFIQTDERGIMKKVASRKTSFKANWAELTRVSKYENRKGSISYALHTDQSRMDFKVTKGPIEYLISEIRSRATRMDFSPWD